MERGRIQGLSKLFEYPRLSQERVKLRTSNFVGTFIGSTGTKAHENIGNSGCGCSQGVPKIFRAPICRAHCAVIFAIAQLSCFWVGTPKKTRSQKTRVFFGCVPGCLNPASSAPAGSRTRVLLITNPTPYHYTTEPPGSLPLTASWYLIYLPWRDGRLS